MTIKERLWLIADLANQLAKTWNGTPWEQSMRSPYLAQTIRDEFLELKAAVRKSAERSRRR